MIKVRFNLRKVATIVACLVVTMMFAACDKTNPDDDNGSGNGNGGGKIDKEIIGAWAYMAASYSYIYQFNADGSFEYFYRTSSITSTEGKFTTSKNKVYFTDIIYQKGLEGRETQYPDAVFEYEIGSDDRGKFLNIPSFKYDEPYVDISWGVKFRKQ